MLTLLAILLFVDQNLQGQANLPHITKFGFAQTHGAKVLITYTKGAKGLASLVDLEEVTITPIDKAKANYYYPHPMILQGQFVLLDTLLKKIIYVGVDGAIGDTVHFKGISPQLTSIRITAASVLDEETWILTLEDRSRQIYQVAEFSPVTAQYTPLFEKSSAIPRKWLWLNQALVRITPQTGEIATVDPRTGKRLKLLRTARDLLVPKKKPKWMRELKPFNRLAQVVYGSQTSILWHHYVDDDPEQVTLKGLIFLENEWVETPSSVLGDFMGKRLMFDWQANELRWEGLEP